MDVASLDRNRDSLSNLVGGLDKLAPAPDSVVNGQHHGNHHHAAD